MSLSEDDKKAVVAYRKEKAYNTLKEAEDCLRMKDYSKVLSLYK